MRNIVSLVMIFTLVGCASVVEGKKQKINVGTNVPSQGSCTLTDKKGMTYTTTTPGIIEVNRGDGPLQVSCNVDGGVGSKVVNEDFELWTLGNLFIPLIWPLTFAYDGYSGAYQTYPDDINVNIINVPAVNTPMTTN